VALCKNTQIIKGGFYMVKDAIICYIETLQDQKLQIPRDFFKEQPHIEKLAVSV
jgi:hypothetical protein